MIKIYGMETCPDCTYVEEQVKGNNQYEVIDIGQHVRDLRAFLRLRDHNPAFNEAKSIGAVGIPCFVLEERDVPDVKEEHLRWSLANDLFLCLLYLTESLSLKKIESLNE